MCVCVFNGSILIYVSDNVCISIYLSMFNSTSTFVGYLIPKPIPEKNSSGTI